MVLIEIFKFAMEHCAHLNFEGDIYSIEGGVILIYISSLLYFIVN